MPSGRFEIEYDADATADVRALSARDRALVLDSVEEHLRYQADEETRNRKRLAPNDLAGWELRLPPLRVFYDIEEEVVMVRAVLLKIRAQTYRRGRRIDTHE